MAKALIAEKGVTIEVRAASQQSHSTYLDDGASGGTRQEVDGMAGSQNNPGTIAEILSLGGFTVKAYVVGGQCTEEEALTLTRC